MATTTDTGSLIAAADANSTSSKPTKSDERARPLEPYPFFYYRDFSRVGQPAGSTKNLKGANNFPVKMHIILNDPKLQEIVGWLPHGRSWRILRPREFELKVIPAFFEHTKFSSFIRQANGWGFRRVIQGRDRGSYYHEMFLKGMPHLCQKMKRPGKAMKITIDTDHEPDLYKISEMFPLPESHENVPQARRSESESSAASAHAMNGADSPVPVQGEPIVPTSGSAFLSQQPASNSVPSQTLLTSCHKVLAQLTPELGKEILLATIKAIQEQSVGQNTAQATPPPAATSAHQQDQQVLKLLIDLISSLQTLQRSPSEGGVVPPPPQAPQLTMFPNSLPVSVPGPVSPIRAHQSQPHAEAPQQQLQLHGQHKVQEPGQQQMQPQGFQQNHPSGQQRTQPPQFQQQGQHQIQQDFNSLSRCHFSDPCVPSSNPAVALAAATAAPILNTDAVRLLQDLVGALHPSAASALTGLLSP